MYSAHFEFWWYLVIGKLKSECDPCGIPGLFQIGMLTEYDRLLCELTLYVLVYVCILEIYMSLVVKVGSWIIFVYDLSLFV